MLLTYLHNCCIIWKLQLWIYLIRLVALNMKWFYDTSSINIHKNNIRKQYIAAYRIAFAVSIYFKSPLKSLCNLIGSRSFAERYFFIPVCSVLSVDLTNYWELKWTPQHCVLCQVLQQWMRTTRSPVCKAQWYTGLAKLAELCTVPVSPDLRTHDSEDLELTCWLWHKLFLTLSQQSWARASSGLCVTQFSVLCQTHH